MHLKRRRASVKSYRGPWRPLTEKEKRRKHPLQRPIAGWEAALGPRRGGDRLSRAREVWRFPEQARRCCVRLLVCLSTRDGCLGSEFQGQTALPCALMCPIFLGRPCVLSTASGMLEDLLPRKSRSGLGRVLKACDGCAGLSLSGGCTCGVQGQQPMY